MDNTSSKITPSKKALKKIAAIDELVQATTLEGVETAASKLEKIGRKTSLRIQRDVFFAVSEYDNKKLLSILKKNPELKVDGLTKTLKENAAYWRFLVKHNFMYEETKREQIQSKMYGKDSKSGMILELLEKVSN